MAQLRQDYPEFERRGVVILVIGPEDGDTFTRFWQEHRLPFRGLPDPRHEVLRLYGQEVNWLRLGRMPAQFIIDRQGVIRFVHYGKAMHDIPKNSELLAIIDGLL